MVGNPLPTSSRDEGVPLSDQRIGLRYAMPAMTPAQTSDYITHHLKLAPDGPTRCSATTPWPSSTTPPGACRGPSTTSPPRRSSPRWPNARTSSTSSPPAPQSARSRQTEHHHATLNTKAPPADAGGALFTPADAHRG